MDTAKIITALKTQNGIEVFNYYFTDHIDGAWINCFVTMYPKNDFGITPSVMWASLRDLRDSNILKVFGYNCSNQWFAPNASDRFSRFEPMRLVYSKEIAKKVTTEKITFNPDPKILRYGRLVPSKEVSPINRNISIFLFASKEMADEFIASGKDLMKDMTTM